MRSDLFPKTACALAVGLGLAACGPRTDLPLGSHLDGGEMGSATEANILSHTGQGGHVEDLGQRFTNEVPTAINFAFNSAELDATARGILRQQATFIRQFPEVRFSVYGHTDLVGSANYNRHLGLRRAQAALEFLVAQGIDRGRLDALVSLGESQPLVPVAQREPRNRRTVTEVAGFVQSHPLVLDGQYARIVHRTYVSGS